MKISRARGARARMSGKCVVADRDRALTLVQVPRGRAGMWGPRTLRRRNGWALSRVYTVRAPRNCNGLCIKHKAEPPAGEREAIPIKTSPIFRAYNWSDAPLWYRALVAAFLCLRLPWEFLSYSLVSAAAFSSSSSSSLSSSPAARSHRSRSFVPPVL